MEENTQPQEQKEQNTEQVTNQTVIVDLSKESEKTVDILALEAILKYIISVPEGIVVSRKVDEMGVLITLQVDQADMGVVIGRGGEMANSIKKYIKKVGQVNNMNVRLRIEEPVGSTRVYKPREQMIQNRGSQVENIHTHKETKVEQTQPIPSDDLDDLQEFSLS